MSIRNYKVIAYIQIAEPEAGLQTETEMREYCAAAVKLDVDTEEHGNPYGLTTVEIDWATLALTSDLDD